MAATLTTGKVNATEYFIHPSVKITRCDETEF